MKPNGVLHYDFNFSGLTLPLQKLAFVPRFSSLHQTLAEMAGRACETGNWKFCLHLVLHPDCPVVKVSNALMSVFQGALVPEGIGKMWLKPSHPDASLVLQIESGEESEVLAPCQLFGETLGPEPFDLRVASSLQAGATQPSEQDSVEFVNLMRRAVALAKRSCLEGGTSDPFKNVKRGTLPNLSVNDTEIPGIIVQLCHHFGMGFPSETAHASRTLDETDYRHISQICRLLALRLELFSQLEGRKHSWKVQIITKECLVSVLGLLNPNHPTNSSVDVKHGLFRQPLAFCFLNLVPGLEQEGNRLVSEEYLFLNVEKEHEGMKRLIEFCSSDKLERTIDYADGIEGEHQVLQYSDNWQHRLSDLVTSLGQEGIDYDIRLHNGRLRQRGQELSRADFPLRQRGQELSRADFPLAICFRGRHAFEAYITHKRNLRQKLGIALEVPDTSEVRGIVERRGFVLTADVVAKAAVFKYRMQIGMNAILQGHTGVGKTEIVELLQHFFASRLASTVHPLRKDRVAQLRAVLPKPVQRLFGDSNWQGTVHETLMKLRIPENEADRAVLSDSLSQLLPVIKHLAQSLPAPEWIKANDLSQDVDELLRREDKNSHKWLCDAAHCCKEYEEAEPAAVFFQELIHPGISRDAFADVVDQAIAAARYWQARSEFTAVRFESSQGPVCQRLSCANGTLRSDRSVEDCFQHFRQKDSTVPGKPGLVFQACDGQYLSVQSHGGLAFKEQPDATCVFQSGAGDVIVQGERCLYLLPDGSVSANPAAGSLNLLKKKIAFKWSGLPWHDKAAGSFQPVILFLDELNTNKELLPDLTALFVDRLFNGKAIPANLFCVGAINPQKADKNIFTVFKLPRPMESLLIDFGELDESMEKKFLYSMLSPTDNEAREGALTGILSVPLRLRISCVGAILDLHGFIKGLIEGDRGKTEPDAMTECQTVTIRDLLRWRKIFEWFLRETCPGMAPDSLSDIERASPTLRCFDILSAASLEEKLQWCAVFALVTNYSFRLPKGRQRIDLAQSLQKHFDLRLDEQSTFAQHVLNAFDAFTQQISEEASEELRQLEPVTSHDHKRHTDHVILYRLLNQNLFVNILGLDADIPNMIVAPPGHSKTFSMTMATQVLQISKGSRATAFFKARPHLSRVFHFQGSALSTPEQLMQTYRDAGRRKQSLAEDAKRSGTHAQSKVLVVIDEAGRANCTS